MQMRPELSGRKFCARCGKAGDFDGNICPSCSPPTVPKSEKGKPLVETCRKCGRWRDGKSWRISNAPEGEMKVVVCPLCLRGEEHKETTIQLRSRYINDFIDEALRIANDVVESEIGKGKFVRVKQKGNDLEFTNHHVAEKVASEISKRFGVKSEKTSKLVTFDNERGKEVRRATILITLPEVKVGDKVRLDGEYAVKKTGAIVILEDVKGNTKKVTHKRLKDAKLL